MKKTVSKSNDSIHIPVLLRESISYLRPMEDGLYIDATLGLGGHTESILEASDYKCRIFAFDVDDKTIEITSKRLEAYSDKISFVNKNFISIDKVIYEAGETGVDGIIADIGTSSYQLESGGRGFSFLREEPLDMRMDPGLQFTAYDLVNEMNQDELSDLIYKLGEESFSRQIAKSIIKYRKSNPIKTSTELSAIVSNAIPKKFHPKKIHPATKTFQALRIAVNNELENLRTFIEKAVNLLNPGGRLVIISFHSLEDRIVKKSFNYYKSSCVCPPDLPGCACSKTSILEVLTKSPVTPTGDEIKNNPRSRSSKMRVGEKRQNDKQ